MNLGCTLSILVKCTDEGKGGVRLTNGNLLPSVFQNWYEGTNSSRKAFSSKRRAQRPQEIPRPVSVMFRLVLLSCLVGKRGIVLRSGTSFRRSEEETSGEKKHLEELQQLRFRHVKGCTSSLDCAFVFWKLLSYKISNLASKDNSSTPSLHLHVYHVCICKSVFVNIASALRGRLSEETAWQKKQRVTTTQTTTVYSKQKRWSHRLSVKALLLRGLSRRTACAAIHMTTRIGRVQKKHRVSDHAALNTDHWVQSGSMCCEIRFLKVSQVLHATIFWPLCGF